MNFPGLELAGSGNAIRVSSSSNGGVFEAPEGLVVYGVVPDPSATVRAISAITNSASMSETRLPDGAPVAGKMASFYGSYSRVEVTVGAVDVYLRKA